MRVSAPLLVYGVRRELVTWLDSVLVRMLVHFSPSEGEDRICGQEWNLRQVSRFQGDCPSDGSPLFIFHYKQQRCERVTSLEPHLS